MDDALNGVGKTILDNVRSMREQGAKPEDVRAYLAEAQRELAALQSKPSGQSAGEALAGGIRTVAQGATFNFGDELEAAARSVLGNEKYADALQQIRDNIKAFKSENSGSAAALEIGGGLLTGGAVQSAAKKIGGKAAAAIASGAGQGMLGGVGAGETAEQRAIGGAGGAVGGFLLQRAVDHLGTLGRAFAPKAIAGDGYVRPLDVAAKEINDARKAADNVAFRKAAVEAGQNPSSVGVQKFLSLPDIQPQARALKNSLGFADEIARDYGRAPTQSDIVQRIHRNLGQPESAAIAQLDNANPGFKSLAAGNKADIQSLKARAKDALDEVSPSFRPAVDQSAKGKRGLNAFTEGAQEADRLVNNRRIAPDQLVDNGEASVLADIAKMSPQEARLSLEGVLGTLKNTPRLTANPISGFGTASSIARVTLAPHRLRKLIGALDERAGTGSLSRALTALAGRAAGPLTGMGTKMLEDDAP